MKNIDANKIQSELLNKKIKRFNSIKGLCLFSNIQGTDNFINNSSAITLTGSNNKVNSSKNINILGSNNIIEEGCEDIIVLGNNNIVKANTKNVLIIGDSKEIITDGSVVIDKLFVDGGELTKDTGKILGYKDGLPTPDAGEYPIVFDEREGVHKAWNGKKWQPMYNNR